MAEKNLNLQNLDLSLLETLSPAEKELALSILKEYAEKGESSSLNDILLEDYAEPPVDILTFVDDYKYLGNAWHDAQGNSKLYPYWRKELVKIFPDNLTTSVNNAIFSGSRGRGKEQPISSLVLSDKGFIRMGDVTLDTKVFGCDGKLHPVTGIYPQGVKDVYEITFSDGTTARCGLEHLWKVVDNADATEKVLDTKALLEANLSLEKNDKKFRYSIPVCKPIEFEERLTLLEPYQIATVTNHDKGIDEIYLHNSVKNRIELLQGYLDKYADVIVQKNMVEFVCTNKSLNADITWLVQSLGGITVNTDKNTLIIKLPEEIVPFKSKEKITNYKKIIHIQPYRYIAHIEKLDKKEECQCIMVGSEEHLYITDNFIVTHNTEIAVLIAAYLLHRVLCLKDPVAHFHLKPTEKLVFAFMNIKLDLAKEIGIAKFQNTIQSSPWFLERGTLEGRTKKMWVPKKFNDQEAIDIKIGSQADDLIGLPIYFCLDGDTEILTSNGVFKIKNLVDKQIKVPTISDDSNIVLSNICSVKQTAESNIEYEIKLEDNTIIKCTPNHRFRLVDGSYKEAQNLNEDDELADYDIKPFGYIYKFVNLKTNKIYIGKREKPVFDEHYYGSGKLWKSDLEKYGKENIKREILCFGFSREELNELEKYYIKLYNAQDKDVGYNIHKGGQGGNSINDTEKWSEMYKGAKNGRYHKVVTLETRLKISAATKGLNKGVKNPKKGRPGKPKPPGFGDKISAYLTGRVKTGDALINIRKGNKITALKNKGKQIYNNGINEKRFFPNDIIPEGYVKGRLFKKPRKVKDSETQIKRGNSNENKKY